MKHQFRRSSRSSTRAEKIVDAIAKSRPREERDNSRHEFSRRIAKFLFHFAASYPPLPALSSSRASPRITGVFSALRWALWKSRWSLVGRNGAAKVPRMRRLAALSYALSTRSSCYSPYERGKKSFGSARGRERGRQALFTFPGDFRGVFLLKKRSCEVSFDELCM